MSKNRDPLGTAIFGHAASYMWGWVAAKSLENWFSDAQMAADLNIGKGYSGDFLQNLVEVELLAAYEGPSLEIGAEQFYQRRDSELWIPLQTICEAVAARELATA